MTYLTYSEFVEAYKKYLNVVLKWLNNNAIIQELYLGNKIIIMLQYDSSGGMDMKIKIVKHMGEYQSTLEK
jgi:hypothetical protein